MGHHWPVVLDAHGVWSVRPGQVTIVGMMQPMELLTIWLDLELKLARFVVFVAEGRRTVSGALGVRIEGEEQVPAEHILICARVDAGVLYEAARIIPFGMCLRSCRALFLGQAIRIAEAGPHPLDILLVLDIRAAR